MVVKGRETAMEDRQGSLRYMLEAVESRVVEQLELKEVAVWVEATQVEIVPRVLFLIMVRRDKLRKHTLFWQVVLGTSNWDT